LVIVVQQLIAPRYCRIHCPLALREIARADGRQQDIALEAKQQLVGG
jgi:hypothetical protein